jgi:hypothetical protein
LASLSGLRQKFDRRCDVVVTRIDFANTSKEKSLNQMYLDVSGIMVAKNSNNRTHVLEKIRILVGG